MYPPLKYHFMNLSLIGAGSNLPHALPHNSGRVIRTHPYKKNLRKQP